MNENLAAAGESDNSRAAVAAGAAVVIQHDAIDIAAEYARLLAAGDAGDDGGDNDNAAGAVATFIGRARGGDARAMTLEHYPGMTDAALRDIVAAAMARFNLIAARVTHRVGRLLPGEAIVFVGALSRHRAAAFDACAYITDHLKTDAPFWKKEELTNGGARWVAARESDDARRAQWRK